MAHMGDAQKAVIGRIRRGGHAKANAKRHTGAGFAPGSQPGGIRCAKPGGGYRPPPVCGIADVQANRLIARRPALKGGPDGAGQHIMACPHLRQAFFGNHVQRLAQAIQMMGGGGACPILPELGRIAARPPIPIGRAQIGRFGGSDGFVGKPQKPHAGRCHQALLAGGHCHINTPGVHVKRIATKAGHTIHRQQRRMICGIYRRAQAFDIRADCRCGIHMGDQHRFDFTRGICAQSLLDKVQIKR